MHFLNNTIFVSKLTFSSRNKTKRFSLIFFVCVCVWASLPSSGENCVGHLKILDYYFQTNVDSTTEAECCFCLFDVAFISP